MYHSTRNPVLVRTPLTRLRPTQFTVGYAEVEIKARQWGRLGKKERKIELERHVFPAVRGLGKDYFIVDHHHLGVALLEEGMKEVFVAVLDDLSWLKPPVFWRTLEYRSWTHP
ncbi:MAG TPA: ParB-like protein, partial [Acetobacteraceae bacterium]|nr:ParB-like protein [Acetobacteraceae bacterium]